MPSSHETSTDLTKLLRASARYLAFCLTNPFSLLSAVILTAPHLSFQLLFFSPAWLLCSSALPRDAAKPTLAQLNLHNTRVRRNPERLPSSRCIESAQHRARARILPARASDTALRLVSTDPFVRSRRNRELQNPHLTSTDNSLPYGCG